MDDSGDFYGASWEDGGGELGFNGCGKEVVAGQIAAGQTRCLRWWRRLEFTVAGIGSVAWAEGWHRCVDGRGAASVFWAGGA
ncbi:hypothetical protein M0R45_008980 [Rubus argutus]|uniref:Uncharacterized protein n=1 Tax=Rubus argutus TaxID=59490 RepID=A0AAW1Y2V1_RUBAR